MALPPEARRPKTKKIKKRRTLAPSTTDRTSPSPPPPKPKKGPVAPQQTGKVTRPAPKRQPGPVSDKERKRIRRHKETEQYQEAIREARKHGPATRRGTRRLGGDDKSDADRARAQTYVKGLYRKKYGAHLGRVKGTTLRGYQPGSTVPPDIQKRFEGDRLKAMSDEATAGRTAPVGKVLEQTTRPLHGVAGGTRAAIKGENVPKAVKRGLQNKDKSTFSDVLDDLGVQNKAVKAVVGTGLDIALDPTTYVTGGTTAPAKIAAKNAAKQAEKKAAKAGLSPEQVKRMGERAARQAEKKAGDSRGVTVRFAGREIVPGTGKATAKVGAKVKRATDGPKVLRKAKDTVRHVAADVNPNIKSDNISRADFDKARQAARTARSSTAREVHRAKQRAAAVRKAVGKDDQRVLDAIESGKIRELPENLRPVAKRFRDDMKYARRLERRAGIPVKERKNYVPHALKEPLEKGEGITSVGSRKIQPSFSKGRKRQGTLAELRETHPGEYSEDAALLHANRMVESAVASKRAELNRSLLDMGRRLKKGSTDEIREGEAIVHIKGSDVRVLDKKGDKAEVDKLLREGNTGRGGQYVILNKQTVVRAIKGVVPASERTTVGELFDRGQGVWKWLATVPNIGFHVRNLVGDTQNAYLAENAGKLAVNTRHSAKALKRLGKREEALRTLSGRVDPDGNGLKIKGKHVTYDELLDEAEKHGAIRGGFINRELPELLKKDATGVKKIRKADGKGQRISRGVSRAVQNREDLMRLATYIGGRKRGLTPEQAVARMSKYHFDYADLTSFERSFLRRAMPFYTFSARNIPLQLKSFFTKPGKFANYQKIREEFAKAFGIDMDELEESLPEYEQRAAGIPVKWKGAEFTLSFGPSGLPLTDLNEMPLVDGDPIKTADEWMNRAMSLVTPAAKTPVELWSNFSFFFRDQIERESGPLVPAPAVVANLPKSLRDKLGVVSDYVDRRTGKKGWGWPAKIDYIANQLSPGPLGAAKRVLTPSEQKGKGTGTKLLAYGGVRAMPVDKLSNRIQELYEERSELGKKRAALNQRGMTAENPTPEWRKVNDRYNAIDKEIAALRVRRGDKIVPRRGRPKTTAPSGGGDSFWDSGSSSDSFWK